MTVWGKYTEEVTRDKSILQISETSYPLVDIDHLKPGKLTKSSFTFSDGLKNINILLTIVKYGCISVKYRSCDSILYSLITKKSRPEHQFRAGFCRFSAGIQNVSAGFKNPGNSREKC